MKAKKIAVVVVILMSLVMLMSCSETSTKPVVEATAVPTETVMVVEPTATPEAELDAEIVVEPDDIYENGLSVQTPVGEFKLPEEWNEKVFVEEASAENYEATWYTIVSEKRVDLFTMYVGASDVGYYFGNAKDADGKELGIYVNVITQEPDGTLTEEQNAELNTMREGVNFIIEQVYALPTFERMG